MPDQSRTPRRALVVIDVQNEYFESGGMPIAYPPIETSLQRIAQAMDAARKAGIPVVVVQHDMPEEAPIFGKGSGGWDLHTEIAGRTAELRLNKSMPSVFTGTPLAQWLKEQDVDTLTVVGFMIQNCNASTVYEAYHAGFTVEVLSDASGAPSFDNAAGAASAEEIHRVFNVVFHSNFAAVAATETWVEALRNGQPLPRDNILESSQRARQAARLVA